MDASLPRRLVICVLACVLAVALALAMVVMLSRPTSAAAPEPFEHTEVVEGECAFPVLLEASGKVKVIDLELPSIGWQLFILDSSQSDSTAFPSCLDT